MQPLLLAICEQNSDIQKLAKNNSHRFNFLNSLHFLNYSALKLKTTFVDVACIDMLLRIGKSYNKVATRSDVTSHENDLVFLSGPLTH